MKENDQLEGSLSNCLKKIKNDFKKNNELALISQNWKKLVGEELYLHCTPLSYKNRILIIGSSHPQWRQALFYTRNNIIDSLKIYGYKVNDIKIKQYHPKNIEINESEKDIWDKHPSRINDNGLTICKLCGNPAPYGEIIRWHKCVFCKRKEFNNHDI